MDSGVFDAGPAPAPSPGGALVLPVRCRTRRSMTGGRVHEVTITPDWDVVVPHDLRSERIAAALGGYLSCLTLCDMTVPAARIGLARHLRVSGPQVAIDPFNQSWIPVSPADGCCRDRLFPSAGAAAGHARSVRHLSAEFGAPRWQLNDVMKAILAAHGNDGLAPVTAPPGWDAAQDAVSEPDTLQNLFDAGVNPQWIAAVHRELGLVGPLPSLFYLAAQVYGADLPWIARTLSSAGVKPAGERVDTWSPARRPSKFEPLDAIRLTKLGIAYEPVVTWLASTHSPVDSHQPLLRAEWLSLGIPRRLMPDLWDARYQPSDLVELREAIGGTITAAALILMGWIQKGWRPQTADLAALANGDPGRLDAPGTASVKDLRRAVGAPNRVDDVTLALWLCAHAPVQRAAAAWESGDPWLTNAPTPLSGNQDKY